MTKTIPFKSIIFLLALFTACVPNEINAPEDFASVEYLHLAHTRTNTNPKMDSISERIDYSKYDLLMLGGDLANQTSEDEETMTHVDSIFDLSNPKTLWSLGNHDYSDLERVTNFTKRPAYYTHHQNQITYIVLDTQDSLSNIIGEQKAFLERVLDTIQNSSHLILLHHKLIWLNDNDVLQAQFASVSNGPFGDCFYCINSNNFYEAIYPNLIAAKQKGIDVLCIGGDIGKYANEFEYTTPEGIHFLASGIATDSTNNKALVFKHDIENKRLAWEYKLLSDL